MMEEGEFGGSMDNILNSLVYEVGH